MGTDYKSALSGNVMQFFPHAEGYVNNTVVNGNNVFNYTDHLGNVRVSYGIDPATSVLKILEENNYYPFGLKHTNYNIDQRTYIKNGLDVILANCATCPKEYKYNGKELQDELGLNLYDYRARNYDPALGRWMNIDPLSEKYNSWSGYNYALNNPVLFIDPDGREIDISELMKSKDHAKAFIAFAKTKEGIKILNKYASVGQKLEYGGEVFYQAGKAGKYDKKGIDLNYSIASGDIASKTGIEKTKDGFDINIEVAKKSFGTDNTVFNLGKAIIHESFLHAELDAKDVFKDGVINQSSVPSEYRQYDDQGYGAHAQHFYIGREFFGGSTSPDVLYFPINGFNALKEISKNLKLNYSDIKLRTIQWGFNGSLISIDPKTGKISYSK